MTELTAEVEEARDKIQARLDGLKPLVVEYNFLRIAQLSIESRLDRPRTKSQRAFAAIVDAPGSSTTQIAAASEIALASLYPVLRSLTDQGLAHRVSRRWYVGPGDSEEFTSVLGLGAP